MSNVKFRLVQLTTDFESRCEISLYSFKFRSFCIIIGIGPKSGLEELSSSRSF